MNRSLFRCAGRRDPFQESAALRPQLDTGQRLQRAHGARLFCGVQEVQVASQLCAIGTALSEHGLPRWLDSEAVHVVLFVSPVCSLCDALVGSLKGVVPAGLTLTVTAADPVRQREWASAHDLDLGEVVFDDDRSIVDSLGVTSSPTAIGVEHGKVLFAAAVGGPNALTELLDAGRRIGESPDLKGDKSPESLIGGNDDELSRHKHS